MAALTFTATLTPSQPRDLADGINIATAKYINLTGSLSASDVVLMLKLPEGATIIDGYLSGKIGGVASCVVKMGIGGAAATDDDLIAAVTLSATTKLTRLDGTAGLPYQTPAIAAATYPKYNWLTVTGASGSFTASISIQVAVTYTTGNLSGL